MGLMVNAIVEFNACFLFNFISVNFQWCCPKCILDNPSLQKVPILASGTATSLSPIKLQEVISIKTENESNSSSEDKQSLELETQLPSTDLKASDRSDSDDRLEKLIFSVPGEENDKMDVESNKTCDNRGLDERNSENVSTGSLFKQIDNMDPQNTHLTTPVEEDGDNDRASNSNAEASLDDGSNQSSVLLGKRASNSEAESQANDSGDDLLVEQYRRLLPNYDRQREVIISKEEMDNLRALK